jgi:hypothetical protein
MGLGGATWALAVSLKFALAAALRPHRRMRRLGRYERAVVSGLLSGASELGLSAICFLSLLGRLDVKHLIAFGVGASSAEVCLVMSLAFLQKSQPECVSARASGVSESNLVRFMQPLERFFALSIHVTSRWLVYVALFDQYYFLGVFAFVCFCAIDGLASFGHASDWNWFDPTVAWTFYGVIASLASIQWVLLIFTVMAADHHADTTSALLYDFAPFGDIFDTLLCSPGG